MRWIAEYDMLVSFIKLRAGRRTRPGSSLAPQNSSVDLPLLMAREQPSFQRRMQLLRLH